MKESMLELKSVTLADKPLFDEKLQVYGLSASDMCFTAIYMWSEALNLKYLEIEGLLCCIALTKTIPPYWFSPIGDLEKCDYEKVIAILKRYCEKENRKLMFRRLTERDLSMMKQLNGMQISYEYSRGSSDYVYLREDLVTLSGKKYHGKRNHISRFLRENGERYAYLPLQEQHIPEVLQLNALYSVCKGGECQNCLICEKEANTRVIANMETLGCIGAMIQIDGEIKAYTVGQMLNNDTAIIHIEKADRSIKGLYPMINREFCKHAFPEATYINREEDMDIAGLRKAKLSYHPVRMEDKYNLTVL